MNPVCRLRIGSEEYSPQDIGNEEDLRALVRREASMHCGQMILGQLDYEFYCFGICCDTVTGRTGELTYYNDSDDYEDEMEFGSQRWLDSMIYPE